MHLSVLYLLSQKGSNISPHSWLHASAAPGYPEEHSFPSIQHSPWISERCVKSVARSHAAAGACASAVGGVPATKRRKNAVSAVRLVKRITGATSCAAATPAALWLWRIRLAASQEEFSRLVQPQILRGHARARWRHRRVRSPNGEGRQLPRRSAVR